MGLPSEESFKTKKTLSSQTRSRSSVYTNNNKPAAALPPQDWVGDHASVGHPINVTRKATQSYVKMLATESKVVIAHRQPDASYTVRLPVDKGQMGKYFNENT